MPNHTNTCIIKDVLTPRSSLDRNASWAVVAESICSASLKKNYQNIHEDAIIPMHDLLVVHCFA